MTLRVSDPSLQGLCESFRETLAEAFVVSGVMVHAEAPGGGTAGHSAVPGLVGIKVERARGRKCQRCWKHLESVGVHTEHPTLCERCVGVVVNIT